ncbi:MAG TPA: serine hydrolase domain-containing protein [Bradyrhizobium sp.]|uniref:serine hydrolase domain-containing protein n=1 Tax=Bradyrhizobium sp. TaxID=376 RepID=UPI002BD1E373|nr:serine hydrolase domain-containing protein [Bradyrhizobium sp.]HLZ02686.1 serine hydrolase domain-containing protein [Bradyrhizobium sp.]
MEAWLGSAADYVADWLEFQLMVSQQPGVIIAITHRGEVIAEHAFGFANLDTSEKLTPRHRFRIASHSKAFSAAGVLKLREQRKLRLDDAIGDYINGLHPGVAAQTIAQVLSHSAGLTRDGADSGQFIDSRPYLTAAEVLAELKSPPAIAPNTRFKYSNHGFALVGLLIEAVTSEPYETWIKREIVDAAGLRETVPNMPLAKGTPFARGHTRLFPAGRRFVIPGDNPANAMNSAAGFVATAADTARFFAQLAPNAKTSVLSVASRREMTRRHRRIPQSIEAHYGLGVAAGTSEGFDWFGHGGGFQGYLSRTAVLPDCEVGISILSNSIDGAAPFWMDGCLHILRTFKTHGAPARRLNDWRGRWWTVWYALDLVPMGDRILVGNPHMMSPFMDATEIEITGRDKGRITAAAGYASFGEEVRRSRNKRGEVTDIWLAGANAKPGKVVGREMERRYGIAKPRART